MPQHNRMTTKIFRFNFSYNESDFKWYGVLDQSSEDNVSLLEFVGTIQRDINNRIVDEENQYTLDLKESLTLGNR